MKKIVLSLAMMLTLSACPSPNSNGTNTGNNTSGGTTTGGAVTVGANGSFATKADFIAFLNCLKDKPGVDAEAKNAISLQITAVGLIPDAQWAMIGAQYGAFAKTYLEIAKSAGCAK
ncbi:MAG: hypothetical protein U0354_13220 [Candidatus Sericytochromatia bacterium]